VAKSSSRLFSKRDRVVVDIPGKMDALRMAMFRRAPDVTAEIQNGKLTSIVPVTELAGNLQIHFEGHALLTPLERRVQ
jgi:hypothetical protein